MKKLFILFIFLLSGSASAEDYYWKLNSYPDKYPSAIAAASCYKVSGVSTDTFSRWTGTQTATYREFACKRSNGVEISGGWVSRYGDGCTAPKKYDPVTGECKLEADPADLCKDKNPFVVHVHYGPGRIVGPSEWAGCAVTINAKLRSSTVGSGTLKGTTYISWELVRTGAPASGGAPPADVASQNTIAPATDDRPLPSSPEFEAPSNDPKCPKGTVAAGVSMRGVPICVGSGSANDPKLEPPKQVIQTTWTNPTNNQVTTTTRTTTPNADGSSTTITKEVTVDTYGKPVSENSSSSTTTTPAGKMGTPDNNDKTNFCHQNPTLAICRPSSVTGTCGDTACTGDAIQCATLRAAAKMECAQQKEKDDLAASPLTATGNQILSGADPKKAEADTALAGTKVDMSKPNLDASGFLGGGACIANKSFQVLGKTVEISFTSICGSIQPLRAVFLAIAYLVAYLIVSRSVLNGG